MQLTNRSGECQRYRFLFASMHLLSAGDNAKGRRAEELHAARFTRLCSRLPSIRRLGDRSESAPAAIEELPPDQKPEGDPLPGFQATGPGTMKERTTFG